MLIGNALQALADERAADDASGKGTLLSVVVDNDDTDDGGNDRA